MTDRVLLDGDSNAAVDGVHTIPVPRCWSPEQAWEAIKRNDALTDKAPSWANVVIQGGALVEVLR